MKKRIDNFNAGPAVLPLPVLEKAREDIVNFRESGLGIMEISHRTKLFETLKAEAEQSLRNLLNIPDSFKILFTTGGATNQFSMVPMNLVRDGETADYVLSGVWAEKAYDEGKRLSNVHIAGSSKEAGYKSVPQSVSYSPRSAYVHFTSNNTIYGTQCREEPSGAPSFLVCDASSDILSRPINLDKYGVIYAGAQKNLGIAGITVVIIRQELMERAPDNLPVLMNYKTYAKNDSLQNTIPTFPLYILARVLRWIEEQGGVPEMEARSIKRSKLLYDYIDSSNLYLGRAEVGARSRMNITFNLKDESLTPMFLQKAEAAGFSGLKGHKLIGGLRASAYNGIEFESVERLIDFMQRFEREV